MEQIVTLVSRVYDKDLSRLDQFESKGRSVILSNIINRYTHVLYINLSSSPLLYTTPRQRRVMKTVFLMFYLVVLLEAGVFVCVLESVVKVEVF